MEEFVHTQSNVQANTVIPHCWEEVEGCKARIRMSYFIGLDGWVVGDDSVPFDTRGNDDEV